MPTGHVAYSISELDLAMIVSVPQGGNWKNIPHNIPSKRLEQIRNSGGRTTLYGRLEWDKPSFTITTYFNRPGNGTYIHPDADRTLTSAEAARFQSFPDSFCFTGSKTTRTKQIGNAVPPLLAYQIARNIKRVSPELKTMVDLFCGSGGLSLGFKWAGFECLVANDNFREASETYALNFPETDFVFGDISEIETKKEIFRIIGSKEKVDLVVGGPPCQGFSNAGKRLIDDPRNVLYKEFISVVSTTKPKVVLMENVEGILSMGKGQVFAEIRKDIEDLGYFVEARKLNAADYGVPQRRKRVIIIGSRKDEAGLMFPEKSSYLTPTSTNDAIGDLPVETVELVDQNVIPHPPKTMYQKFMQGKVSPKALLDFLESGN